MKKSIFLALFGLGLVLSALWLGSANAQFNGCPAGFCSPKSGGSGPAGCTEATTYINALNATGTTAGATVVNAVTPFICNVLVGTNSTLGGTLLSTYDFLYILGNQVTAFAQINVVNPGTYNASLVGTPTFNAFQGYTGTSSPANYVTSNFNPNTASSPKYVNNSANYIYYLRAFVTDTQPTGGNLLATFYTTGLYPRFADGNAYFRINDNATSPSSGAATANGLGLYVAVRTGALTQFGYKAAVGSGTPSALGIGAVASGSGVPICPLVALVTSQDDGGPCLTVSGPADGNQISLWGAGKQQSATDVGNIAAGVAALATALGW